MSTSSKSIDIAGKCAIVIGAGPAGLLAATMLSQKGFTVEVFEKAGEDHKPQPGSDTYRSYAMLLDGRATYSAKAVGVDTLAMQKYPCRDLAIHRLRGPPTELKLPASSLTGRYELVQHLLSEMRRLCGDRVTLHYSSAIKHVDTVAQTIQVSVASSLMTYQYDLLVGADGYHSAVRHALEQQVAGFTSTDDGFHEYHRVTRVSNLLPDHTSTYLDFFQLADARCQQDKYQPSGVVYALAQIQGDHRLEEQVVTLHKDSIANYTTVEQCRELLAKSGFRQPGLEEFAQQLASPSGRWTKATSRIRCSQLHGPAVVLLGDAGHAVTPENGQGCNAAFEDVSILANLLDQQSLDQVPEAFTKRRLADVHALYLLNKQDSVRKGFHGLFHIEMWAMQNDFVLWGSLHKLMPAIVAPPLTAFSMHKGQPASYAKVVQTGNRRLAISLGSLGTIPIACLALCLSQAAIGKARAQALRLAA